MSSFCIGSIIWLPDDIRNESRFRELWFLGLKPKYYRLVIPAPLVTTSDNWFISNGDERMQTEQVLVFRLSLPFVVYGCLMFRLFDRFQKM
jgi:hypothetical protein